MTIARKYCFLVLAWTFVYAKNVQMHINGQGLIRRDDAETVKRETERERAVPAQTWPNAQLMADQAETAGRYYTSLSANKSSGPVLYVIHSDSRFYSTRIRWIMDTWAANLPRDSVVVIGDKTPEDAASAALVHPTGCQANSHGQGMCCKRAGAVLLAQSIMMHNPFFKWAMFVDDDVYVRPEAVERLLFDQPPDEAGNGVILGTWGCVTKPCSPGLCGGGGFAADRNSLRHLVAGKPAVMVHEQMMSCARCEHNSGSGTDVAIARLFDARRLERRRLPGTYPWQLKKACFDLSLTPRAPSPLLYHYMNSQSKMYFLHKLFNMQNASSDDKPESTNASCAVFQQRRQCIDHEALHNDRLLPWLESDSKVCTLEWLRNTGSRRWSWSWILMGGAVALLTGLSVLRCSEEWLSRAVVEPAKAKVEPPTLIVMKD